MRRSLALFIATLAVFACITSVASARVLNLSPWMRMAMTDHYVYWVKEHPKGCARCNQLWRTSIEDGSAAAVLPARAGRIIKLTAKDSQVAITETRKLKSRYSSQVRVIDEAGGVRMVASAIFHPRKSTRCGSMVGAGAFSLSGELAWQRIDVPHVEYRCEYMPMYSRWSAYATDTAGHERQLMPPRKQMTDLTFYYEALSDSRPIYGFDGRHLLVTPSAGTLTELDSVTHGKVSYTLPTSVDNSQHGDLGPGGEAATFFFSVELDQWAPILFPGPMSAMPAVDLHVDGTETTDLRFCGNALLQVTNNKGDVSVIRRDSTGIFQASKKFKLARRASTPQLVCSRTQGVMLYDEEGSAGRIFAEKAFSFDLP
jgi:hypothetical protein